jgi:protein-S-isoprenylcysteine O-methyltransferase Ste14
VDRLKVLQQTKLYDLLAASPLIAWYIFLVTQALPSVGEKIALVNMFIQTDYSFLPAFLVLTLVSKLATLVFIAVLIVMLIVRRLPMRSVVGFYPRFVALAGTVMGVGIVLLPPQEISLALSLTSLVLIIIGTAIAIVAALTLARSISIMPEARRLVTVGPYAIVRHPLYIGEMIAAFGVALQYLMPWALLFVVLHCVFQFQRMILEERVLLRAFPDYGSYTRKTARLVPGAF